MLLLSKIKNKFNLLSTFPKRKIPILFLNKFGFNIQINENIKNLCIGDCIEIGAYSRPASMPRAKSIKYADILSKSDAKKLLEKYGYFRYHRYKFVDVDILFKSDEPPLISVPDASVDTVYSCQSLEHSPNPVAALWDYIRVLKTGGVVYTIIPNKDYTEDCDRVTTPINKLIRKYKDKNWTYTLEEFREVIQNSHDHEKYPNKSEQKILEMFIENDGSHHIYCYDASSALELILYLTSHLEIKLILFDASNKPNIHFALQKL